MNRLALAGIGVLVIILGLSGCGGLFAGISLLAAMSSQSGGGAGGAVGDLPPAAIQGSGLSSAVPPQYVPWVKKAGSICPEITPAIIAAQIEAESDWDPNSNNGIAYGISQLIPEEFTQMKDEDHNGTISPFDPADEIPAQGKLMCYWLSLMKGGASGDDLIRYALASYNAGAWAVIPKTCAKADRVSCIPHIPQNGETPPYVDKIMGLISKYQGVTAPTAPAGATAPTATIAAVIAAAKSQLGVQYVYGGGSLDGPSPADGGGVAGFDCSSFVRYAWYQGTGHRLVLPRTADEQAHSVPTVTGAPQPGDLIFFDLEHTGTYDHVGMYLGNNLMIHAPNHTTVVKIVPFNTPYWTNSIHIFGRPS